MRAVSVLLAAVSALATIEAAAPPRPPHAEARRLIRQLGNEEFETRQTAREQLLHLEPPDTVLREGLHSGDLETVRAIRQILSILTQRRIERASRLLKVDSRAMHADLFAERFLLWHGPDDSAACWQPFLDLNWNFIDHEKLIRPITDRQIRVNKDMQERSLPRRVFSDHLSLNRVRLRILPPGKPALELPINGPPRADRKVIVARGERVVVGGRLSGSLLVCSGSMELGDIDGCFVLSAGDVRIKSCVFSVVISGGDCVIENAARSDLVVRGKIKSLQVAETAVLRAGGDIQLAKQAILVDSELHAGGKVGDRSNVTIKKNHKLVDNSPLATDFVRFFELRRVGLDVIAANGGVEVARAGEGRSFATAGVRKGDLIVRCGEEAVESPETLRRMIRKRVALGAPAQLTLRRGSKEMSVRVVLD